LQSGSHCPLTARRPAVSVSVSLPSRGSFHRSLAVLVRYRSHRVFSLGTWASLLPTGFLVTRGTHACGARCAALPPRGSHPLWRRLPTPYSRALLPRGLPCHRDLPPRSTPSDQRRQPWQSEWFRLLPFRSPLLRECSLFLAVLRCFSSRGSLPQTMCSSEGDTASPVPRCRIRRPRDHRAPAPPPGISLLAASFVGPVRLGIPRRPFSA
jgi:hypothetical protein